MDFIKCSSSFINSLKILIHMQQRKSHVYVDKTTSCGGKKEITER